MRGLPKALALLLLVVMIAGASYFAGFGTYWFISQFQAPPMPAVSEPQQFKVFWEVWDIVEREFYGELPTFQEMTYSAIRGMLGSLGDPNTVFIEPQLHELEETDLRGSFEGIGAVVTMEDGRLFVVFPIEGQPAVKAGIKAGDEIIKVDDKEIAGLSLAEAVLLIRGPRGTKVQLTVLREGEPEPLIFEVIRDRIETPTIAWKLLEEGIGYVRLSLLGERTKAELIQALRELEAEGMTALVLDLRNNPGGTLTASVEVASQFLKEGIVLYERDSEGHEQAFSVQRGGLATEIPLVVLVNEGSASAAEIVAGAIQDHGRGVLIGERTFGKGFVQHAHELSDGSGLHVTVAIWLTPNRREIGDKGLLPDIVVPLTREDIAKGKDPQLDRALEYLKTGR